MWDPPNACLYSAVRAATSQISQMLDTVYTVLQAPGDCGGARGQELRFHFKKEEVEVREWCGHIHTTKCKIDS